MKITQSKKKYLIPIAKLNDIGIMKVLYRRWETLDVHRVLNEFLISRILEPSAHLYIIRNWKIIIRNWKKKTDAACETSLIYRPIRTGLFRVSPAIIQLVLCFSLFNSTHIVNHLSVQCLNSLHLSTTYSPITPFFLFLKVFQNSAGITFESVSSFNNGKTIKESVCWTSLSGLSDVRLKRKLRAFTKTGNTGITRNTGTAQINGTQEHPGTPYITASVPGCSGVFWYSGVPGFSTFPS